MHTAITGVSGVANMVWLLGECEGVYMFRAIWEFAQSRGCVAHSQNPEIAFQSRDCAAELEIA